MANDRFLPDDPGSIRAGGNAAHVGKRRAFPHVPSRSPLAWVAAALTARPRH